MAPTIGSLVLVCTAIVAASGLTYLVLVPWFYSIPILASLALAPAGIASRARSSSDGHHTPRTPFIAIGSTLVALTIACRPAFIRTAVFGIILLWPQIRTRDILSTRVQTRHPLHHRGDSCRPHHRLRDDGIQHGPFRRPVRLRRSLQSHPLRSDATACQSESTPVFRPPAVPHPNRFHEGIPLHHWTRSHWMRQTHGDSCSVIGTSFRNSSPADSSRCRRSACSHCPRPSGISFDCGAAKTPTQHSAVR